MRGQQEAVMGGAGQLGASFKRAKGELRVSRASDQLRGLAGSVLGGRAEAMAVSRAH